MSFLTVSCARGEMPSPVWLLMAKAPAFHVVIVSGTFEVSSVTPEELERILATNILARRINVAKFSMHNY